MSLLIRTCRLYIYRDNSCALIFLNGLSYSGLMTRFFSFKTFQTLNTKHSLDIQKHSIVCFNINNAMSSYAEFEVPVIRRTLRSLCSNGDKRL